MYQTHGDNIQTVNKNSPNEIKNCDALITNEKNLPIMVTVADCIPVLIYDEKKEVIAVVHSGRAGCFKHIVKKTIQKMEQQFSSNLKDIKVHLGPSIKKCCYEVGQEILDCMNNK
jgi:YfiH family protein